MSKPLENLGGLIKIWAVPPSDIIVAGFDVAILSTSNIIELYCSPESMQMTESNKSEQASVVYDTEITATIPGDSSETLSLLNQLSGRKWIVILLDQNEQFKASGTNSIPHRFSFDFSSGKAISDLNSHEISFHSTQLKRAIQISNPFV
jgi:hypothetical protein